MITLTLLSLSSINCLAAAVALSACFFAASASASSVACLDTSVTSFLRTLEKVNGRTQT